MSSELSLSLVQRFNLVRMVTRSTAIRKSKEVVLLMAFEGLKILLMKDHICSTINGFRERIGAITTNTSFEVGRLN